MTTPGTKRKRIDSSELNQILPFKEIANTLNVSHSQVSHYKDQIRTKFEVEQIEYQERKRRRISGSGRAPDVQAALLEWYHEAKLNNIPITGPILIYKAKQLATRLNLDRFTPSYGWLDKWGIRNDIWLKRKKFMKAPSVMQTPKDDTIIIPTPTESNGINGSSSISTSTESNGIEDKSSIPTSTTKINAKDKSSIPTSTQSNGIKDRSSKPTPTQSTGGIKDKSSIPTPTGSIGMKYRPSTESIGIEDSSAILTSHKRNSIKGKFAILVPSKDNVIEDGSAIPTPSKRNGIKEKSSVLTPSKSKNRSSMLTIKGKSSILKPTSKHRDIRSFLTPRNPSSTNDTHIVDTQLKLTFTKPCVIKDKLYNLHPREKNGTNETSTGINSSISTPVTLNACRIKQEPVDSTVCNTKVAKETLPRTNFEPHSILARNERISSTSTYVNLNACSIKQEPIDSTVCNNDVAKETNFRPIKLEPVELKLTSRPPQILANINKILIKQEPKDRAFAITEETQRASTSMAHVSTPTPTNDIPPTPSNEFQKQTVPVTNAEARGAVTLLRKYCGQHNISAPSAIEKLDDIIYDKIKRQTSIVDFVGNQGIC